MNYEFYKITMLHSKQILSLRISSNLKPEPLEEITTSRSLLLTGNILLIQIPVLKNLLQSLLNLHFLLANKIRFVDRLLQIHIHLVTSGEHMTHIDILDKRLHCPAPLLDLLLGHAAGDLAGSACDSSDEAVGEAFVVVVAVVDVFDDDGFFAGVAAGEDDYDFSGFDDGHVGKLEVPVLM